MAKRRGRPRKAANLEVVEKTKPAVACKKCGSLDRTPYANIRKVKQSCSVTVIYRTCRCLNCGQARREREIVV